MMKNWISIISIVSAILLIYDADCKSNKALAEKQKHLLIDGIDVDKINKDDLNGLLNAEDEKFTGELDIWIGKQSIKELRRMRRIPPVVVAGARVLWVAGRYLMKSFFKKSVQKKGLTRFYFKEGGYSLAKKDFWMFKPKDIKHFTGKNGQKGITGKILDGKYTLTVRKTCTHSQIKNGGKIIRNGRPTLEIRSKTGGKITRKIRYENEWSFKHQKHNQDFKNNNPKVIRRLRWMRSRRRGNQRSRSSRTFRGGIRRSRASKTRRRNRYRRGGIRRSRASRTRRRNRYRRGGIRRSRTSRTRRRNRYRRGGIRRSRASRTRRRNRYRRGGIRRSRTSRTRRSRYRRGGIRRSRASRTRRRNRYRRGGIRRSRSSRTRSRSRSRRGGIRRTRSYRSRRGSRSRSGGSRGSRSMSRRWG